jgi:hypothetical protein
MVAPSLDIKLNSPDISAFKNKMTEAGNHTGTVARGIAKQFLDMNANIRDGLLASVSSMALGVVGRIALVVGAFKLMGDTISAVRGQIQSMTEIAEKSQATGFSPEFWQSWVSGAKGAEKQVEAFEGALQNAYQALKPVLNPNWSVWDEGLKKVTAVEDAMRGMRELFTTDQDFSGFDMFRNAKTQDDQLLAALTYMKQLKGIGQEIAAIDLAEKLFGSTFADKIRTNQISIDQMLDNIKAKSPDAFSNEIVLRAKELDTQLKNAWHTVDQNLHPSLETLDSLALSLKSVWVEIVELMARGSKLLNPNITGTNTIVGTLSATGEPGFQTHILNGEVTQDQKLTPDVQRVEITGGSEQVPMPRRRPNDIPKPAPTATGGVDRFETSAESIERRVAALRAEAHTLDLSAGARDKARIAAQLQAMATQANAAAGLGENVVTAEQRKRIEEVADAYGKASDAIARAKVAGGISFGQQTGMFSPEDVAIAHQLREIYPDVATAMASVEAQAMRTNNAMQGISATMSSSMTSGFADILDGTKSVSQGFADMGRTIVRAIEEAIIKLLIVQPLMRMLGGAMGGMAGGGAGIIGGLLGFADGGFVSGPGGPRTDSIPARLSNGEFVVNARATAEHRPLLDAINSDRVPRFADGGVVGNVPAPAGGMVSNIGGTTVAPTVNVTVQGSPGASTADHAAMGETIAKQIGPAIQQLVAKELRTQSRPGGMFKGN